MPRRSPPVRAPSPETRPLNKLLACLPEADFTRLRPHLRTLPAKAKQVFHVANQPIRDVYFPNGGVASVTMAMNDGQRWRSRRSAMKASSGSPPSMGPGS